MSARQGISFLFLAAIHLVFIAVFFLDDSTSFGVKSVILSSAILLIFGYFRAPKSEARHSKIETLAFPFVIAAAGVLTYYFITDLAVGPVVASAGIGSIASYFPNIFKSDFLKSLPDPIYCGTFVGMCGSFLTEDYFFISYAGLAAGVIYILTRDALNGVGGKLGTIAFGGVVIVSFIFGLL